MRTMIAALAGALALAAGASVMLAAPGQTRQPGQMTPALVWVQNRTRGEAIPISLQEAPLDGPLRVRVMNGLAPGAADEPLPVRIARQPRVWQYQTVTVKRDDNPSAVLNPLGLAGWEAAGIAFPTADGTTLLLKRLR